MVLWKSGKPKEEDPAQNVMKKQYKKAIEIYQAAIKKSPADTNLRLRYADALAFDNQIAVAVKEYGKVADDYAEKGFLLKAIGVSKKIVKLDPSRKEIHKKLSALYEEKGLLASKGPGKQLPFLKPIPIEGRPKPAEEEAPAAAGPAEVSAEELVPAHDDLVGVQLMADLAPDAVEGAMAGTPEGLDAGIEAISESLDLLPEDLDAMEALEAGRTFDHQRMPLFSDFTAEEFAGVVDIMSHEIFENGAVVVREGDPGDAMFVIITGEVRVDMKTKEGSRMQLAVLRDGDFFGEGALLTGRPRTATITANAETETLKLTKEGLDKVVAMHPRVKDVMNDFLIKRVQSTIKHLKDAKHR